MEPQTQPFSHLSSIISVLCPFLPVRPPAQTDPGNRGHLYGQLNPDVNPLYGAPHAHPPNLLCLLNAVSHRRKQPAASNLKEQTWHRPQLLPLYHTPFLIGYTQLPHLPLHPTATPGLRPSSLLDLLRWSLHVTSLPPAWRVSIPSSDTAPRPLSFQVRLSASTASTRKSPLECTVQNDLQKSSP